MTEEIEIDLEGRKLWLIDTYQQWLEEEGLPIIKGYSIPDLMTVQLKPWERKGGLGGFIQLVGAEDVNDAYVCEIPPRSSLKPQKHLFDELIYILSGTGGGRKFKGIPKHFRTSKSVKLGGDQIEFGDEAPDIRRLYEEELAKTGARPVAAIPQ